MAFVRYQTVILLFLILVTANANAEGLDELIVKPKERNSWAQTFAEALGYDSGFSKSYALVVGISQFENYSDLPTAKDPLRVRDFLLASGFDEVHTLTEEKVSVDRLRTLMLDEFPQKVDENDRFLLYWSGHGIEHDNSSGGQTGFLPLANSSKKSLASMASMEDIAKWDELLKARHALYLIDACFGGLAGVVAKSSHADLVVEQLLKPARFVLTAGSSDEEVIASDKWGGSLFTDVLLSGLAGSADTSTAESPADGVISLHELIDHIKKRVAVERYNSNWTKSITPQLRDLRSSDGEFFFLTGDIDRSILPVTNEAVDTIPKSDQGSALTDSGNERTTTTLASTPEPKWQEEVAVFVDNPFKLCGFEQFSVSLANNDANEVVLRSKDRSIPDQPFRGFKQRVPMGQLNEIFTGCTVMINTTSTTGTPRIRIRVKEEAQ